MAEHNILGNKGEEIAVNFLINKNYNILEKSWRFKHKEIDIIAFDNDILVFVEVKTRTSDHWGNPEDFVTIRKQKFLIEASEQYIDLINFDGDSRFDVIAIVFEGSDYHIEHIETAFYP